MMDVHLNNLRTFESRPFAEKKRRVQKRKGKYETSCEIGEK